MSRIDSGHAAPIHDYRGRDSRPPQVVLDVDPFVMQPVLDEVAAQWTQEWIHGRRLHDPSVALTLADDY